MAQRQRIGWPLGVAVGVLAALAGCTPTPTVTGPPPSPATSESPPETVPDFSFSVAPPPSSPPATAAVIYGCDSQPVVRPATFLLLCGDAGEALVDLAWSDWGQTSASATGRIVVKSCTPDCADGASIPYVATVTVTGLFGGGYTKMHISAPRAPVPAQDFAIETDGPRVLTRLPTGY
ncbi:MAG TPA: hypothetical protein VJX10_16185 [Pseudonocardiaceae bacterium]|nr:hypothetical protein [Pseudonocardiaceae bacterium]